MKVDRSFAGAAGEYAVASELSRRGWAATLTRAGSRDIDVLAWHAETRIMIALQVKTASPGRRAFQLKTAHEIRVDETNEWFAFVRLDPDESQRPRIHLVPRNVVAAVLYAVRLEAESRGKSVGAWRNFLTQWVEPYAEAWEDLLIPTDRIKRPLSGNAPELVAKYGRPVDLSALEA